MIRRAAAGTAGIALLALSCVSRAPAPHPLAALRTEAAAVEKLTAAVRAIDGVRAAEVVSGMEGGRTVLAVPVQLAEGADRSSVEARIKAAALGAFPGAFVRVIFISPPRPKASE